MRFYGDSLFIGMHAGGLVPRILSPLRLPMPSGSEGQLFLVHPMGGSCAAYTHLLAGLPRGLTVLGLDDPSLGGSGQARWTSLASMVAAYVAVGAKEAGGGRRWEKGGRGNEVVLLHICS